MAVKAVGRNFRQKKVTKSNDKPSQENMADEIALRDEIFELKRQVMILRRANEQNLIKFRKYEDEAKRKDRQIEQLMDPRKNADIAKILSTKGAAILMNLKDQNNSLIKMILNKDLQIRRLTAEIKTSKLYASCTKVQPYRAEIVRLRNLLIKSQELLKESMDLKHQTRSIYVNGNASSETPCSSDQSTPRELEELRFTIQSLETHIKYSNELLAKRNQEILGLTDELNTLKNASQCKACRKNSPKKFFEYDFQLENKLVDGPLFSNTDFLQNWRGEQNSDEPAKQREQQTKESSAEGALELFEKTMKITNNKNVPNSAPTSSLRWLPSNDITPKHSSMMDIGGKIGDEKWSENFKLNGYAESLAEDFKKVEGLDGISSDEEELPVKVPALRKSLLHDLAAGEVLKEEKAQSARERVEKSAKGNERWKNEMSKYKQLKKPNSRKSSVSTQSQGKVEKKSQEKVQKKKEISSNSSDLETHEFEIMEKEIQNDPIEIERDFKSDQFEKMKYSEAEGKSEKKEPQNDESTLTTEILNEDFHEGFNRDSTIPSGETKTEETSTVTINAKDSSFSSNGTKIYSPSSSSSEKFNENKNKEEMPSKTPEESSNNKESIKLELTRGKTQRKILKSDSSEGVTLVTTELDSNADTMLIKREIHNIASTFSPEIQRELQNLYENISSYEEIEMKKVRSLREIYQQSFDSSFDSENSYSVKREAQLVQVEVQINSVPTQSGSGKFHDTVSESDKPLEFFPEDGKKSAPDDEFNDDDDVVVR